MVHFLDVLSPFNFYSISNEHVLLKLKEAIPRVYILVQKHRRKNRNMIDKYKYCK